MARLKARNLSVLQAYGKSYLITMELDKDFLPVAKQLSDDLRDKELSVEVKQHKEQRSRNANSYAWALMDEIANVLRADKEKDVYVSMLAKYGQTAEDKDGNKIIFSAKAHINVSKWEKYVQKIGDGYVNGELFHHYRALKGSSEFDTREMSIFLDGIIEECKALEIPTETPEQIQRYKDLWEQVA